MALISLLDRERQWLLACQGVGVRETPRNISFCGHAILQEGPFIVHDAAADERFRDNPRSPVSPHIRFYAGQPVSLPDGTVAGTLCLIHTVPRAFTDDDIASLRDLACIVEDEFEAISMAMTDSLTGIPNRRGFLPRRRKTLPRDEPAGCVVQPHLFRSGQVQTGERSLGTRRGRRGAEGFCRLFYISTSNRAK